MAFHPKEFAMDPDVIDRIRDEQDDRDPLQILIEQEDAWVRDRDSWDFNRFIQTKGESND